MRSRSDRMIRGASMALGLALALLDPAATRGDDNAVSAANDASKPFVVKIHADWCGTCQMLGPVIDALDAEMGSSVCIVVLDVTNRETALAAADEAKRLGIEPFFERYRSKTGTVGVLDGSTREIVAVLSGEFDLAAYERAVARANPRTGA